MALPPEQIRIKRRRQDEPVEILCTADQTAATFTPDNPQISKVKTIQPREDSQNFAFSGSKAAFRLP